MNFGRKLLEFRAKHNMSQVQLAKMFGVATITICRYEMNKYKPSAMHKIVFEEKMRKWEENEKCISAKIVED